MHSDLMKETVFHDLNHLYPGRITNKTNGITFRRWLMLANPKLTGLMREVCGEAVLDDFSLFERLEAHASDNAFQQRFREVKHHNKLALARLIGERLSIKVDPSALFDIQIKRIHEYKRQLLNVVETVALYQAIKDEPQSAAWLDAEEKTGLLADLEYADRLGHIPYAPEFFVALGTVLARRILSLRSAARKVIALDCDNTLWAGITSTALACPRTSPRLSPLLIPAVPAPSRTRPRLAIPISRLKSGTTSTCCSSTTSSRLA
jgi:hypothetical protein